MAYMAGNGVFDSSRQLRRTHAVGTASLMPLVGGTDKIVVFLIFGRNHLPNHGLAAVAAKQEAGKGIDLPARADNPNIPVQHISDSHKVIVGDKSRMGIFHPNPVALIPLLHHMHLVIRRTPLPLGENTDIDLICEDAAHCIV